MDHTSRNSVSSSSPSLAAPAVTFPILRSFVNKFEFAPFLGIHSPCFSLKDEPSFLCRKESRLGLTVRLSWLWFRVHYMGSALFEHGTISYRMHA